MSSQTVSSSNPPPVAHSAIALGRVHARRLREIYRSAGWPCQDSVEIELLAAGLLERLSTPQGHERVRLTDAGIAYAAQAFEHNRKARSAHEALVALVAQTLVRDGRIVWTGLSVRARLGAQDEQPQRWRVCQPDVFSIRNTSVAAYLEPVVHEIKVSRADLLGDLKFPDKRNSYLDVGGQCWYVLGTDAKGRPIAQPEEVPAECGVLMASAGRLEVARYAPKRAVENLPFSIWMALAKALPLPALHAPESDAQDQSVLIDQEPGST